MSAKTEFLSKGGHEFCGDTIQPTAGAFCVFKGTANKESFFKKHG